jgi:A1 cistron-splicing factor AAR2
LYITSVQTLAAQLTALPEGVFDTELPELDVWLLGEIDALRNDVKTSVRSGVRERVWAGEGSKAVQVIKELETAWGRLIQAGRRYQWEIERLDLQATGQAELDEESEEEGEYAPIVVDM